MANLDADWDAATEQLYDELMSRTWALHGVLGSEATDVARPDVRNRLADAALRTVGGLRLGDDDGGRLDALLWPPTTRPDADHPWWSTPLGKLMRTGRRHVANTSRAVIFDLVSS